MLKKPLILIGGGGHCRSCIDVIRSTEEWEIKGILDREDAVGKKVHEHNIIGTDEDIDEWISKGVYFLLTIGQTNVGNLRRGMFDKLKAKNARIATVISSRAYVSRYATIGQGSIIHHNCLINTDASVGENCIVNTGALLEHDSSVGSHTHISTTAVLNGGATVGEGCFVGSGSIVSHNLIISDNILLGAGSVVIKDLSEPGVYIGVPAKKMR